MQTVPLIRSDALDRAFRTTELERLVSFCRAQGCRAITVDGFAGVGKSTFAGELSSALGAPLVSLDEFLPDDPESMEVQSYVERLDRSRLRLALERTPFLVIEGVLLRDAISGIVTRTEVTSLYYLVCSKPSKSANLIWHDGLDFTDGSAWRGANWFNRSILEYHKRVQPYADADALIIRTTKD